MSDPNYKLIADRTQKFQSFSKAIDFIRKLKSSVSSKEVLVGQPMLEEIA